MTSYIKSQQNLLHLMAKPNKILMLIRPAVNPSILSLVKVMARPVEVVKIGRYKEIKFLLLE